ncbi:MAG: bifunctional diaminohydroxyphosphoribosylaminopyrimidine deaminase/5-amino-6-(5-phosphoribosylamino)uracil reductase RibD [Aestuariivita sp.]|nr:bifunctional diaminohydroxyphosphoribosylaminopyrimidine deaminase/5-amino-6-(5-phosphoribosylamino)uracil reductase RibD [Aestuariivita sp.]MCY4203664.1 bifunctional diaminohydroxyphosphoribosylaminopyrimidine deaminase/5-amino-6-(5-phosphoribosylamino)uracil reductase RibD [Aestuariivita sp.]MCY4287139.1 bifunctional diaminohydroxyphosphoribosylaminopyrimidine deaminase/5-amino-6-(5-phosphoribosylamino)uracil reductase RibD [Aestuariivita sp.]MCY4345454.1 bifunctional diaminohydroxyphosphor
MASATDERWMRLALSLGRRGCGGVWPNPAVGCVLVKDEHVVGRGWTQSGGRPHAETEALGRAGAAASGSTAYVSLEPCSHQGQTGACADALISAKISRLVVPLTDPDPRVSGRGLARLERAGVAVTVGVCADEAMRDHQGFFLKVLRGRPKVTLKLAFSVDGRIATSSGQSKWITGPQARRTVHALRARHDAVWIGAGTARSDDPSLTVRGLGERTQPIRIVTSRHLDLPLVSQFARSARQTPLWVFHGPDVDAKRQEAWQKVGANLIRCKLDGSQIDPTAMVQHLASAGLTRVLCEGGGVLAASLLKSDVVDEIVGISAGLVIGANGLPAIGKIKLDELEDALQFKLESSCVIGDDLQHIWVREQSLLTSDDRNEASMFWEESADE